MAKRRAEGFSQSEGSDLVAVAARNPETGPPLAGQYGVDHLTNWQALIDRRDVDTVAICTHIAPSGDHGFIQPYTNSAPLDQGFVVG